MDSKKLQIRILLRRKMASDLHRTATTTYPCCVPTLGDFAGAGRVGLAGANIQSFKFGTIVLQSKFN